VEGKNCYLPLLGACIIVETQMAPPPIPGGHILLMPACPRTTWHCLRINDELSADRSWAAALYGSTMSRQLAPHARTTPGSHRRRTWWAAIALAGISTALLGGPVGPVHATPLPPPTTWTVTDCANPYGPGGFVTEVGLAGPGDTVAFACSGSFNLTSTLAINQDLTIDGAGHSVTISGGGTVQLLSVSSDITLSLNDLTLSDGNSSGNGGAIDNAGLMNLSLDTFVNNTAGVSGGAINNTGFLAVGGSTFTNNTATTYGGAIYNADSGAVITIASTFNNNTAGGIGGAIENDGDLLLADSTLANNQALIKGGGVDNNTMNTAVLLNDTLSGNSTSVPGGGGGLYNNAPLTLINSIVAGSSPGSADCGGAPVTDNGGNLDSDGSCGLGPGHTYASPGLAPLADNGGPTQTMALLPGSPAIGLGLPDICQGFPISGLDQRGEPRPTATCDSGAYQTMAASSPPVRSAPVLIPLLAWAAPAAITYGTTLDSTQLDAVATINGAPVAGTIAYSPSAGTILHAGAGQQLAAAFTPLDGAGITATGLVTITVNPAPTTLTLTADQTAGDGSVTLSATVGTTAAGAGTPSGTVTFSSGSGPLGPPVTLVNGLAGLGTSSLAGENAVISAVYIPSANGQGGSDFAGSTGSAAVSVARAGTTTSLGSIHPTGTIGQSQVFTARVIGNPDAIPTGTVSFMDLGAGTAALLGTVPLDDNGQAQWISSTLTVGPHSVRAVYSGDNRYQGSQSTPLTQSIRSCTAAAQLSKAGVTVVQLATGARARLSVRVGKTILMVSNPAVTFCVNPGRAAAQAVVTGTVASGVAQFPKGHPITLTLLASTSAHATEAVLQDRTTARRLAITGPFDSGSVIQVTTP